jgi:GWxTD domain-containing protein
LSTDPIRRRTACLLAAGLLLAAVLGGCRLWRLERRLDPANADFLNKVRYIVTSEERRIFLELPDDDKPAFIEEFWKRRDPDPGTEENEFKDEFFRRMDEANHQFISEGIPGWLTDRGRILILFGPPTDKFIESMSGDPETRCLEVWYYGNFPVLFVDSSCTGHFVLATLDLTAISGLNLTYMHAFNRAQFDLQTPPAEDKKRFDVRARLMGAERSAAELHALVVIDVPYNRIWFKSEGSRLFTDIETAVEILDGSRKTVRAWKSVSAISLEENELREKWGKSHTIEVPIAVEAADELLRLGTGPVTLLVAVTNKTGNEISRKMIEFR